jgi:glutamate racemase
MQTPIALFDSGVGGLSVLREVRRQLPTEHLIYFADQAHVPYGPRTLEEIRIFARGATHFFLEHRAKAIVIACNAASAASLHFLRELFPEVPFVGMEPAVKPAAEHTSKGIIGVITTKATYQGELFASVIDRFAAGVEVITQVCPDFVTFVEEGQIDTPAVYRAAEAYLRPLLATGIDQLVIGCTHFPFLTPVLEEVAGPHVTIIDPSPAVARQTGRVTAHIRNSSQEMGTTTFFTSGDPEMFRALAERLLGESIPPARVQGVRWKDERIIPASLSSQHG